MDALMNIFEQGLIGTEKPDTIFLGGTRHSTMPKCSVHDFVEWCKEHMGITLPKEQIECANKLFARFEENNR